MVEVYVITQGLRWDYEVMSVWTDKAKADRFVELYNANIEFEPDHIRVEVFELDAWPKNETEFSLD